MRFDLLGGLISDRVPSPPVISANYFFWGRISAGFVLARYLIFCEHIISNIWGGGV